MSSFTSTVLTPETALQTITDFTTAQHTMSPDKKRELISEIEKVFTEHAYQDARPSLTSFKHTNGQFGQFAPILVKVAKELGLGKQTAYRLIANIMQVCQLLPGNDKHRLISGILIEKGDGEDCPFFSGWVKDKYLDDTKRSALPKAVGCFLPDPRDMEPFTLLAIQHFQEAIEKIDKGETTCDLPYSMFVEVALFARDWGSKALVKDLERIRNVWGIPAPLSRKQEYERVKELYGDRNIGKILDQLAPASGPVDDTPEVSLVDNSRDDETVQSRFDPSNPIASIVKFTARCCTLPPKEQRRFLDATRKFFEDKLHERGSVEIPKECEHTFALFSLPFLMKAIQTGVEERRRFLAAVQSVTNRSFPHLCKADLIQLVYPRNMKSGAFPPSVAWIPGDPSSSEVPINPLKPLFASETTLKVLSNLSQATPTELIASLHFALSNTCGQLTRDILKLMNRHLDDTSTRGPLTEVLIRELHHETIKAFAKEKKLQFDLESAKKLTGEELFYLFLHVTGMTVGQSSPSINEAAMKSHEHSLDIMRLFVEMYGHLPQQDKNKYMPYIAAATIWAKNKLVKATARDSVFLYSSFPSGFLQELFAQFSKLNNCPIEMKQQHYESVREKAGVKKKQMNEFYRYLKDLKTGVMARLAKCENERLLIIETMESIQPELKSYELIEELVSKSFPELQGKVKDPLYEALHEVMKIALNSALNSECGLSVSVSEKFPLTEDTVRQTRDALVSSGSDHHFVNTFRKLYQVDRIEFEDQIREELARVRTQDPSLPPSALAFIEDLSQSKDEKSVFETLLIRHAIGAEESLVVHNLLTLNEGILSAFKSRSEVYAKAVQAMRGIPSAIALSNAFMEKFKISLPSQTHSERLVCETLLGRILQAAHRRRSIVDRWLVEMFLNLESDSAQAVFSEEFITQACVAFSDDAVGEWFRDRGEAWMQDALSNTFLQHVNQYNKNMVSKLFMNLVKAKNLLSDKAIECLDSIFDVMHEVDQDRIIHRLKTNTDFFTLSRKEIKAIESVLGDYKIFGIIHNADICRKIRLLRSTLAEVEEAPEIHTTESLLLTQ